MKKVIVAASIIFFFLFVIALLRGGSSKPQTQTTKSTRTPAGNSNVSEKVMVLDNVIYHQANTPGAGVPFKTAFDSKYPKVSVYWVQESVAGGQDTCTLYDTTTKQIYAESYNTNSSYVSSKSGTAYYTNDAITKDDSLKLLNKLCFQP